MARPAEQPKQRLLRAGVIPIEQRYEDGRVVDIVTDQGPAFPSLPIPIGEYQFLGHTTMAGQPMGLIYEMVSEGHTTTTAVGACEYETQVVRFYSAITRVTDGAKEGGEAYGRFYISEELGFPLRWEHFADASYRKIVSSETVGRIERLADVSD